MKQRMRITHAVSRILSAIAVFTVIVCLAALTVGAANTKTETTMTYDFATYTSNNDAILNGWSVVGELPYGASRNGIISVSGGFAGASDYATREGYGLYENLEIVYTVPAADRIVLAEYDAVRFTRKLVNADNFLVSGAKYAVIFTLDNGEKVRVEKEWITPGETEAACEVDIELQTEFEALPTDAKLVSISFMPYVNSAEFRPDTAVENQLLVQFLVGFVAFEKAVDMPEVECITDNYNGLDVLEHDGQIIGLDPEFTYEYKLTYASEWTRVSGVSEITDLTGAGYLIRRVADDTSGLRSSEAVCVNLPRALAGGFEYSKDRVSLGDYKKQISMTPIIGYWTSGLNLPYNAAGRITVGTNFSMLSGDTAFATGYSPLEGAYYRRNVQKLDYALNPEEQIEFSQASFRFMICCSGTFPYLSYQEVSAVINIYVAGRDEPIVLKNLRFVTGDRSYTYNLPAHFPDVKGYIERIEYYPFYNQDSLACYSNNYPQISAVYLSEIYRAPKPSLFVIDLEDGTYKISGFKSSVQYEISYDEGENWELLPEKINYLENIVDGTYYIRQVADLQYFASDPEIIVIKSRREAPEGLSASGTSIIGLNPTLTYEYAPYSLANDMEYTTVTGVSSINSLTPGIWCVRYPEDEENFASNLGFVFIEGSSVKGKVNVIAQDRNSVERGFVTGEMTSSVRPICYYNYDVPVSATASLVMWEGWPKTTDMSINETLDVKYAFEPSQAFDIKELYRFPYKAGFQGSGVYLNSGSLSGFYNKVRFYVVGSDVEYYDVYNLWSTTSKINFNAGAALPADAHGYVVGYQFFYYGKWPEISATMKSGSPYPLWTIYDLTLSTKVPEPELRVQYNADGNFTISGLSTAYSHGYSPDGETFIELAKGTTSFNVKKAGTYYVYAQNTYGMKSELVEVETQVDGSASVTGLSVSGNSIEGFNEGLAYEYRKYSLTNENTFEPLEAGATSLDNLEAGLWEVRYSTATNDGKSSYYLIYGEDNGTIAFTALYTSGGDKFDGNLGYAQGRWTSSSSTCYLDSVADASKIRLATNWNSSLDQSKLDAFYFSYQLTDDEIVPISDVLPFSFYVSFGNTYPYDKPSTTRVRYHVVGGSEAYYDVLIPNASKGAKSTCDILASHPDADGYVVAIQLWPYASFPEGTTLVDEENRYPVLKIYGEATGETDPRLMSRIDFAQSRPRDIELETVNANLYQLYKFTGFDAERLYEYSYDGGRNWIALDAGTTELGPIVGGRYLFRYAATDTTDASAVLTITTPVMTPSFIGKSISLYPSVVSETMGEGLWTSAPQKLSTSEETVTSQIGSSVALNTAYYAYSFLPEHQFTVNENPVFSIDFRNHLYGMGVSYIEGAVLAVDIYFNGSSEPYTLTTAWKAENGIVNGVTNNKLTVDLLDLDPELAGKTVRAFAIRPYSNISLSPSGYNTSSTASHYIYFRILNVGFYSTEENVAATVSETHTEVNRFTGITITGIPDAVDVGTVIAPETVVITANYSDGNTKIVDNEVAGLTIPEFDKPGIFKVYADYRGVHFEKDVVVGVVDGSAEINTLPAKTLYYVGQMFNPEGLSFKYTTSDGTIAVDSTNYVLEAVLFDTVGDFVVPVEFCGQEFGIEVSVIEESLALKLWDATELVLNSNAKKLYGVCENTTAANLMCEFESPVAIFDRTGVNVALNDPQALVGTGFTVATLDENGEIADYAVVIVKGDVNGNGRIDTNDYILIKRAYLDIVIISEGSEVFEAADVNGNGTIDTNDYLQIKNHYRGTVDLFN